MKQRRYSRRARVAALEALDRNGGNLYKTMKETGISDQTLSRWRRAELGGDALSERAAAAAQSGMRLDDELEKLAQQIVAILPEKLYEANLHQIIEALKFVLDKVGQAGGDEGADVYEKLAHLINRYAADRPADGDPEPIDESTG